MNRNVDRREFLGTTAAAGATATLALGSPLLAGLPEEPSAKDSPASENSSANEKIVLAIMGTNGRGQALASAFAAIPNCEVGYICDVDDRAIVKGLAAVAKHQTTKPKTVKDFRKALDDKSVDALVVAAPDHWHAPTTILACSAGKHVYVEKPASHNGHEGMLMIESARQHKRSVQLGTQRRSSPKITEAMKLLHKGEIGSVLFARGWINSTRPSIGKGKQTAVPSYLDYHLWQGPAPERPYKNNLIHYQWHWFWHWGTGEMGNNGIHALDMCRWGMGVDYPTHVTSNGGKFHFDDDQQTPDTQIATFNFGDRAINWEHRTWHRRGFEGHAFGVTFYGEDGSLLIAGNNYTIYDKAGKKRAQERLGSSGQPEHLANFLASIRTGKELNAQIEEGVKSTTLCHLGNIAYRTGKSVHFDPKKREVTGDTENVALWKREYRPGWEPKV